MMFASRPLEPVRASPFPHVLVDNWLDADLYERLRQSFPSCPANSGPTGFTLFWGDPAYDRLIAEDPDWGGFFRAFHSQAFVDHALGQFPQVVAAEARVDLSRARYVAYRETREEKELARLPQGALAPDDLWVRVDIMQGHDGYYRLPHLDHRRRAITLLLYFCDAEEAEMDGGDLVLLGAGGEEVAVRPRHNRMVMFPCAAASLHSVTPIRGQAAPRNFVQVILSSSVVLWDGETPRPPLWRRALGRARRLTGLG